MGAVRRATAQDVADLAGVSRSAVSLVLNGRAAGVVARAKQEAILHAARQLRYRPNGVALSLRSNRSWAVGSLTWNSEAGFADNLLYVAGRTVREAGYVSILIGVPGRTRELEPALMTLIDRQIDGLVVIAPEFDRVELPELPDDLPIVMINCIDASGTVASLSPDEFGASGSAAGMLIDRGHTRLAVLADTGTTLQSIQRVAGALDSARLAELPVPRVLRGAASIRAGYALAREALSEPDPPTALICTRERFAVGALLAVRDLDRRVPDDVSLVSLDDAAGLSRDLSPDMALLERPDQAMAQQGVGMLLHDINHPGEQPVRHLEFICPPHLGASIRTR